MKDVRLRRRVGLISAVKLSAGIKRARSSHVGHRLSYVEGSFDDMAIAADIAESLPCSERSSTYAPYMTIVGL